MFIIQNEERRGIKGTEKVTLAYKVSIFFPFINVNLKYF